MNRARLLYLARLASLRRLAAGLWGAGLPLWGLSCAQMAASAPPPEPAVVRAASAEGQATLPDKLPAKPETLEVAPRPAAAEAEPVHAVPISLDTVLRLAQDQNSKINVAREQVREAFAEKAVAANKWLPDLYIGTSYYRHEGGIQNEDGTVIHSSFGSLFGGVEINGQLDLRDFAFQKVNAERKVWQQRGELSRITSETLLDAAGTYIDLLSAYQSEAIIRSADPDLRKLLKDAMNLAETEPGTRIEVGRIKAEIAGRKQLVRKFQDQAAAAKAKLAYQLGMNPECDLIPVDRRLVALNLVDASPPTGDLVALALTQGPGVREMEGLLSLIQQSMEKANGLGRFIPVVGLRMAEGAFGAGPGERSDWDNRWDMALQVRWNLTELATARDRQQVAQAKLNQLHLSYQDLRGKLTAGVQEAQGAILGGREQLREGEDEIRLTRDTVKLAQDRLKDLPAERKSPGEVLLSLRGQMGAQLNYLNILRDYDKAELRLMVLLGQATDSAGHPCGTH
jgi:outer membrane protein TolC